MNSVYKNKNSEIKNIIMIIINNINNYYNNNYNNYNHNLLLESLLTFYAVINDEFTLLPKKRKAFHSGSDLHRQKTNLVLKQNLIKSRRYQLYFLSSLVTGSVSAPVFWAAAACRSAPRASPECSTNSGARPLSPAGGTPPLAPPPSSSLRPDRNELIATLFTSHSRQRCELGARQGRDRAQGTRCPGNRAVVRARGDARADGGGCWEMAAVTSVVEMCHHVMFPWVGLLPAETERGSEWRAFCLFVCFFRQIPFYSSFPF